jgi:hypothetical protein
MKVNIRGFTKGPKERKIDIKIEQWDTYSMDHTAALIILPLLLQLKNSKQGVPSDFIQRVGGDMDRNYYFDFIRDDDDEVFDKGCLKWEETLDKMIWSFQQLVDDSYEAKYHHGIAKIDFRIIEVTNPATGVVEKMYKMVDENPSKHWYDYIGQQEHDKRIQEGLDLFGKHFRDLWD